MIAIDRILGISMEGQLEEVGSFIHEMLEEEKVEVRQAIKVGRNREPKGNKIN